MAVFYAVLGLLAKYLALQHLDFSSCKIRKYLPINLVRNGY